MLTLNRKKGQRVWMKTTDGESITVEVLGVNSAGTVELGFCAPSTVEINKEEQHTKGKQ